MINVRLSILYDCFTDIPCDKIVSAVVQNFQFFTIASSSVTCSHLINTGIVFFQFFTIASVIEDNGRGLAIYHLLIFQFFTIASS